MKHKEIASLVALILASAAAAQAQTIAQWTFENDAIAVNNSPAPNAGAGTASSIGMNLYATPNVGVTTDDVVLGKGSDTGVNGFADTTQTWRVRGQAGANGAANGWSSLAPIGTQGAVFAASTVGITSGGINVSFDWYNTTQGEANLMLQYTDNGTTWINVPLSLSGNDTGLNLIASGSGVNTTAGSYVSDNLLLNSKGGQDWFTGLSATINDPSALNDPNFAVEMVNASTGADDVSSQGTALNNNSGNWRFDNVLISANAVPEPSTLALAGLGGLAALFRLRCSSNRKS